jgi:hypothetical protein
MIRAMTLKSFPFLPLIGGLLIGAGFVGAFLLGMRVQAIKRPSSTQTVYVPSPEDQASDVLGRYLNALYQKDYATAVSLYGGDYSTLRNWNPAEDPNNLMTLWARGCEENGFNCLEIRNLRFAARPDPDTFNFNVWFSNRDKRSTFTVNGQEMFVFTVVRRGDKYLVTTDPVYTP